MTTHFQSLLAKVSTPNSSDTNCTKLLHTMPLKYIQLSMGASSGLSKEASDKVPDRIEGAISPNSLLVAIPGKLVKVHLENADIRYISGFYTVRDTDYFVSQLENHKYHFGWELFGKGRSVVQWSNPPGMKYVFSNVAYIASAFPAFIEAIRRDVIAMLEPIYGTEKTAFNYCVCNAYANGNAGVNWHTDAEPHLVPGCPIACVSFGSERVFSLAKIPNSVTANTVPALNVRLENGSMIVMAGDTQQHYLHAIAKESGVRGKRFSLTFRVNYVNRYWRIDSCVCSCYEENFCA